MDIVFKEKKFENECNSQRLLKKQYGEKMAKKIRQRLDDLKAVIVLEEMRGYRDVATNCYITVWTTMSRFSSSSQTNF